MRENLTEVLVAGAGPAGATIARLLAMRGRRVTLVDPETRGVNRLEIVSPSACAVFEAVGIGDLLHDPSIARPCLGIRRRWNGHETEIDDFFRRPGGRGFVVDRQALDAVLRRAAGHVGVTFAAGRVVAARRDGNANVATVLSANGELEASTGLIIDATGRPAAVARRMGARRFVSERLVAERCRNSEGAASQEPTWLEVKGCAKGWSYSASGPDGRRERWVIAPPEHRGGSGAGPRGDASSAVLSQAAGHGWLAVGDAAAAFDPITSQGLSNALSSALVAAGAILSPCGLDGETCRVYSDALAATWSYSEAGRADVYAALAIKRARDPGEAARASAAAV